MRLFYFGCCINFVVESIKEMKKREINTCVFVVQKFVFIWFVLTKRNLEIFFLVILRIIEMNWTCDT